MESGITCVVTEKVKLQWNPSTCTLLFLVVVMVVNILLAVIREPMNFPW